MAEKVRVTDSKITDIANVVRQKKNTEASYTLDELETEINSLSGSVGHSVTFRNLDSTGKQHIQVSQSGRVYSQTNNEDIVIPATFPTLNFWIQSSAGYMPGSLSQTSPIDMSTLEENIIITASTGYTNSGEKQLVDMSDYIRNNEDCMDSKYNFTDATLSYFKSVKPTSLKRAFDDSVAPSSLIHLNLLDVSECTDFSNNMIWFYPEKDYSVLNLSSWDTSKGKTFEYCITIYGDLGNKNREFDAIIDISSWDTSNATNLHNLIVFGYIDGINTISIYATIDMKSCTDYRNMIYIGSENTDRVSGPPIKLKNVPSDFNYQTAGFTSEDQFQILSHR